MSDDSKKIGGGDTPRGATAGSADPTDLTADVEVTEGAVREAADAAATSRLAGSNATYELWINSEEGQKFLDEEAPRREKEAKEESKRMEQQTAASDAAMQEYQRRVKVQAEQTKAVQTASAEAQKDNAEKSAEDARKSEAKSEAQRTPGGAR